MDSVGGAFKKFSDKTTQQYNRTVKLSKILNTVVNASNQTPFIKSPAQNLTKSSLQSQPKKHRNTIGSYKNRNKNIRSLPADSVITNSEDPFVQYIKSSIEAFTTNPQDNKSWVICASQDYDTTFLYAVLQKIQQEKNIMVAEVSADNLWAIYGNSKFTWTLDIEKRNNTLAKDFFADVDVLIVKKASYLFAGYAPKTRDFLLGGGFGGFTIFVEDTSVSVPSVVNEWWTKFLTDLRSSSLTPLKIPFIPLDDATKLFQKVYMSEQTFFKVLIPEYLQKLLVYFVPHTISHYQYVIRYLHMPDNEQKLTNPQWKSDSKQIAILSEYLIKAKLPVCSFSEICDAIAQGYCVMQSLNYKTISDLPKEDKKNIAVLVRRIYHNKKDLQLPIVSLSEQNFTKLLRQQFGLTGSSLDIRLLDHYENQAKESIEQLIQQKLDEALQITLPPSTSSEAKPS